jgi:hypothetical protein
MKLQSIALAVIVLAAMSSACASGGGPSDNGGGGGGGGTSGSGGASGSGGGGGGGGANGLEGGAYEAAATDTGNPFGNPDSGDTPITVDSGAAKDGPDPGCGMETTQSACASCCAAANPEGTSTLNAAIVACACGTSGTCSTQCASEVCSEIPAMEGDECYTCLTATLGSGGACDVPVETACDADPGCAAYLSCESTECTSLP